MVGDIAKDMTYGSFCCARFELHLDTLYTTTREGVNNSLEMMPNEDANLYFEQWTH